MLAWSHILVQKIEIQALNLSLKKLQLNRHRLSEVKSHHHDFSQLILYLSGEGHQIIGHRNYKVRSGELFTIPPGLTHGFQSKEKTRPLCLALDFHDANKKQGRLNHRRLNQEILNELHGLLSKLPAKGKLKLGDYSTVISVIALLTDLSHKTSSPQSPEPSIYERVQSLLRDPENWTLTLRELARKAGYQQDYLTRKLKEENGQGLMEIRNAIRLEYATQALRNGLPVAEAALAAGFNDPNYFARWVRLHTGHNPSKQKQTK
ncbi:MAG: helix-turn-helix domain-containing protein [Opitutaceae bacterium]|nr:helix-turn-helix domain-containing protein [Opitutaceae bacterium]